MSNRRLVVAAILLPCISMLPACSTPTKQTAPSIGYTGGTLEQKYRVCREDCPRPTPKELDDVQQPAILVDDGQGNQNAVPAVAATPESDAQSSSKNSNEDTFQIHFDFGMSKPNQEGRKELLRFAELASKHGISGVVLVGQTDNIGTRIYNSGLAKKRAGFVAQWIKSHGINAPISIAAKPACCHPAPYDKTELSLVGKRRVTIKPEWVQINKERGAHDAEILN